jgi:hypothetical protein
MPAVKPAVTGIRDVLDELAEARDGERDEDDRRAMPRRRGGPPMPYLTAIGARMTTKAAVGPEICVREPPSRRNDDAGDDGRVEAVLRGDSAGDGEGHREREGDDADDEAGEQIGAELLAVVPLLQRLSQGRSEAELQRGEGRGDGLVAVSNSFEHERRAR